MKIVFILSLTLSLSNFSFGQDYIIIKHLGPEYAPIKTLIVTQQKITDSDFFQTDIVLDDTSYAGFKKIVYKYLPSQNKNKSTEFGCFELKIKENESVSIYYIKPKKTSIQYFHSMKMAIQRGNLNNELLHQVDVYIKQISN